MTKRKLLIIGFCFSLLCGALPRTAKAQNANAVGQAPASRGTKKAPVTKNLVTITGTIQDVSFNKFHSKTGPSGTQILVAGPQGLIKANLGGSLKPDFKKSLAAGQAVQLTGTYRTVQGENYLIARQMTVSNHQVTLRDARGFEARSVSSAERTPKHISTTGVNQ